MNSHQPNVERAEALLKKKQERLREGQLAMAEYQADGRAVREKTARLRALRLARDAAHYRPGEGTEKPPAVPTKAKKRGIVCGVTASSLRGGDATTALGLVRRGPATG
jgi:hypothetical protein